MASNATVMVVGPLPGHTGAMRVLPFLFLLGCPPASDGTDSGGDPTVDADQDGHTADVDCDDGDELRFPGAPERCNGLDDDCNGSLGRNEEDGDGDQLPDCWACDEAGFWVDTWYLDDPVALKAALVSRTSGLDTCDYSASRRYMFTQVDKYGGQVEGVYTGVLVDVGSTIPDSSVMNTEHTWPQSQGAANPPAECDIHHLYPTDSDANSARGAHPFGEVASGVDWSQGGSERGRDAGGNVVFEPRDAHKGNVARSMAYFAMVYGYSLSPDQAALFVSWETVDPIDQRERDRSLAVAEYQAHANPFSVCDGMVDRVY